MSEEVVADGRLEGLTTLRGALQALGELGVEIESLMGRGYTLGGVVSNGKLPLLKPDPCATNDRDRLSAAFVELETVHGYAAPVSLAWEADCVHHALLAIDQKYSEDVPGVAFWFSQLDDTAFGYRGYSSFIEEEYKSLPKDLEQRANWVKENTGKIGAAEISERLQHNTLVHPLQIFWSGEREVIVNCLKRNGLNVVEEVNIGECIYVLPTEVSSS